MKWKLDGKTVIISFDKDTKFLRQISKKDQKKISAAEEVKDENLNDEPAAEKTDEVYHLIIL